MSDIELQEEEREVLASIYDGDSNFKQLTPTTFQYKYGENEEPKSFLLELTWGPNYPSEPPTFNMDTFYNRNISQLIKTSILKLMSTEAAQWLGCAMTYTLFEALREHINEIMASQADETDIHDAASAVDDIKICEEIQEDTKKNVVKKQQLTKSQKRRQWERVDGKGERPRGWDWVDVVKHLSQTGSKDDAQAAS